MSAPIIFLFNLSNRSTSHIQVYLSGVNLSFFVEKLLSYIRKVQKCNLANVAQLLFVFNVA